MRSPVPIEHLLQHSRWLRELALRLVGDVHTADDLVQATWLAALASGPHHSENVRGWLGRVVRRTARAEHRQRSRRERREAVRSTSAPDPAAGQLVEQAELQRLLVTMVTDLPEPGRTTVLLHFFKGLSPAAIARRHGLPASTVRNRLKRALDSLRERLDENHRGDRRRWLLALVPLAADAHRLRVAAANVRIVSAAACTVALAVGGWFWSVAGNQYRHRRDRIGGDGQGGLDHPVTRSDRTRSRRGRCQRPHRTHRRRTRRHRVGSRRRHERPRGRRRRRGVPAVRRSARGLARSR
jgi:RNA polymerase sigma-70 factor (ECF subfamily)